MQIRRSACRRSRSDRPTDALADARSDARSDARADDHDHDHDHDGCDDNHNRGSFIDTGTDIIVNLTLPAFA